MVRHIVFWKLADRAAGADRDTNAAIIKERLEALVGKIEGLHKLEVRNNLNDGDFDLSLYSELDDLAAVKFYRNHPLHKEVQKFVHEVIVDRASCDIEF